MFLTETAVADAPNGLLIDIGGVVYQGDRTLQGAVEAIMRLSAAGFPHRFLTNTTSRPASAVHETLRALGVPVKRREIFTPGVAARDYLEQAGLAPVVVLPEALREDIGAPEGANGTAVLIGDAREGFTYDRLNLAFRHIRAGAAFLALAGNRYFADARGDPCLDVGAFVAALEYASEQTATMLGKPAPAFFHAAVADMRLAPGEVAMIGDDTEFDVGAAIAAGLKGYQIRTGKWSPEAESRSGIVPTRAFDDLAAAVDFVLGS